MLQFHKISFCVVNSNIFFFQIHQEKNSIAEIKYSATDLPAPPPPPLPPPPPPPPLLLLLREAQTRLKTCLPLH